MDQRGGCCIARYAYDISKMDRIMLRFRPIAPKPASTDGSVSGGGSSSSASAENGVPSVKTGRGKRRRVSKDGGAGTRCNRRKKCSPEKTDSAGSVSGGEREVRTLPLLPEAPSVERTAEKKRFPLWLSFENGGGETTVAAPAAEAVRRAAATSWVKVECVTDTWMADCYPYVGIGRTDEEKVRSLYVDTCPGFVSDGLNRVRWTNPAYKRMVTGAAGAGAEVAVSLVVEEGLAVPLGCAAFTCRVRAVTCGNEKASKTVPCDVWRMDCGGFAWRLDTAAALSL